MKLENLIAYNNKLDGFNIQKPHWDFVRLEDICLNKPQNGAFIKDPQFGEGTLFVNVYDIYQNIKLDWSMIARLQCSSSLIKTYLLKENDLLFVRSSLKLEGVGQCCLIGQLNEPAIFDCHLMRISPDITRVYPLYLAYYFLSHIGKRDLIARSKTTTMTTINQNALAKSIVPLPPLPEQHTIAHILQTVQQTIQTRRKELEFERERKAALMQHLFTYGVSKRSGVLEQSKFGRVPAHWKIQRLDTYALVQLGIAKGRKFKNEKTLILPYLRVANVQDGYLNLSEIKMIEVLESESERHKLQSGDVVVTEGGDFDKLGRGFVWDGQVANCVHQNHIFAIRANKEKLLPEYLAYLIQSNYGKSYFLSVAHKTTNLACINSTKLKAFPTLLPDLDEQKAIANILQACDSKITTLEKEITLHEELFRALLDELMTGRISTLPLVEQLEKETLTDGQRT